MELSLPGPKIFATYTEKNFEMAVKETINDLDIQLKKRKKTFSAH
jgi:putative sigma-54 modulation protein